jgi:hypothetical protein
MLALLWCVVSPGALFLLLNDLAWLHHGTDLAAGLRAVRLEQWVAILLLAAHAWFLWGWWSNRRAEAGAE